jgi:uncharacterized protein YggE
MAPKLAAVGVSLLLLVSGVGVIAASMDGPLPQTEDGTPAATPDETPANDTTPAAPADGAGSENATISVTATASASAAPDTARIRAAVVATAPDAETARQQAAANVSDVRTALREAGVSDEQIRTTGFDINTVREREQNDTGQVRYRAVNEFVVEVAPDRAGEIIDVAVGNGTNQVSGVTFTLSEETRRDLRQDALRDAMTGARLDAGTIADASGVSITGLESASTADVVFAPFESDQAGTAGGSETTIEPGPVEVSATVSVTYRAE